MKLFFYFLREFDELPYAKRFSEALGIEFGYTTEYPHPGNYDLAAGYDGVSVTPCDLSAPVLEQFAARGVKYILCRSIGFDHVDLARAKELGMRVANVSYPPTGVANYAIMLMMMCQRNIVNILKMADLQNYTLKGKLGLDLSYATVGIIGTGRIGATVAAHLSSFGCKLLAYDIYHAPRLQGIVEYVPLDELFARSDVITLHTNATGENYHLLDEATFAKMKDGVTIINTARGKLIDSDALIAALESGKVGAAALDVLENENGLFYYDRTGDPIANQEMALLRSFPNVILCPHTAFYTHQAVEHMVKSCFDALKAFGDGTKTEHEVALP